MVVGWLVGGDGVREVVVRVVVDVLTVYLLIYIYVHPIYEYMYIVVYSSNSSGVIIIIY